MREENYKLYYHFIQEIMSQASSSLSNFMGVLTCVSRPDVVAKIHLCREPFPEKLVPWVQHPLGKRA